VRIEQSHPAHPLHGVQGLFVGGVRLAPREGHAPPGACLRGGVWLLRVADVRLSREVFADRESVRHSTCVDVHGFGWEVPMKGPRYADNTVSGIPKGPTRGACIRGFVRSAGGEVSQTRD